MSKQLNEPITENGITNTNFFNGRLLTAQDLKTDQEAERRQRWQLGRAIGEGIVEGFEVSLVSRGDRSTRPVVAVTKGLAINRRGQLLSLPNDDQVTLTRRIDLPPPEAGLFNECGLPTSTFTNLDKGVYLFVVGPTSTFRERAPMRSVEPNNTLAGCGSKYAVEGVQFDLIKINVDDLTIVSDTTRTHIQNLMNLSGELNLSKLRNMLAHVCFGTEQLLNVSVEPFKQTSGKSAFATYGAIDFMRSRDEVTDCKVPLALIYWSGSGVGFVDMWSARRQVFVGTENHLSHFFSARHRAEMEARFYQFHEQVGSLISSQANPTLLVLSDAFRFVPAAGLVPLRSGRWPAGVTTTRFFGNKAFGPPTSLSGDKLQSLIHQSLFHRSIDLTKSEFLQLYLVSENSLAQANFSPPPPFVVFASHSLPHASDQPRFGAFCQTLQDCRDAYHRLDDQAIFFAAGVTTDSIPARLAVRAAKEHVANYAGERYVAVCKCGCAIGFEKALDLLRDLYTAQRELVTTFLFNWPGVPDKTALQSFANQLHTFLDVATPLSKPSLNQALTINDLKAAVEAQDVINRLVLSFTGGVVSTTSGNLDVVFQPGTEGTVLVLGNDTPVNFVFRVRNLTNQNAAIELSAGFVGRTAWDSFILAVSDMADNPITAPFTLQAGQSDPTNPSSFKEVQVSVVTPSSAIGTDTAILRLTASAPAITRADFDQVNLTFGNAPVTGTPTSVRYSADSPVPSGLVNQAHVDRTITLRYDAIFHTDATPLTRAFQFHVLIDTPATRPFYDIDLDPPPSSASTTTTSMDVFTDPFNLTSDAERSITVDIIPFRTGAGALPGPLTFRARLVNVADPSVQVEEAITITAVP